MWDVSPSFSCKETAHNEHTCQIAGINNIGLDWWVSGLINALSVVPFDGIQNDILITGVTLLLIFLKLTRLILFKINNN